ncbi:MAG: hypothetical protein WA152_00950 [Microgenomates group bacterium]
MMKIVKILIIILFLISFAVGFLYGIEKYRPDFINIPVNWFNQPIKEDSVIQKVEKLMDLPKDEIPAVTSLDNVEKLKNQQFFKKAVVGDKVIIYPNAKRAILYRPSENKIIEVGAVSINEDSKQDIPVLEQENTSTESAVLGPTNSPVVEE